MSSCTAQGRAAKLFSRSLQSLVKGSDFSFQVQLVEKPGNDPAEISGFESATAFFVSEDDTALAVSGTCTSTDRGLIDFSVPAEDSDEFLAQEDAIVEIGVTDENGVSFYSQIGNTEASFAIVDRLLAE
jgi:hypothetical protein